MPRVTGVAMLAGLGAGVYRDAAEAIDALRPAGPADRAGSRGGRPLRRPRFRAYRALVESTVVRREEA